MELMPLNSGKRSTQQHTQLDNSRYGHAFSYLHICRIGSPAVSEEADGCGGSAECAVVGGIVPEGTTVVSIGTSTKSIIYKSIHQSLSTYVYDKMAD